MSRKIYDQYFKFLSRFDLDQIQRVEHLLALLESNPEEVKVALNMRSSIDVLKERCKSLLNHVKAMETKYGKDKVYFPPQAS